MTKVRVPLKRTSPLIKAVARGSPRVRWDATWRLRVALANNNGGVWWCCQATKSVRDLERRFKEGSVASVLYDVVGGMLGDHRMLTTTGRRHYLYVQLARRDEFVDLSLHEVGLRAVAQIPFSAIRWH